MDSDSKFYIGIDLGGTKIEIVALDELGNEHFRKRVSTPKHSEPSVQYSHIIQAIEALVFECETTLAIKETPVGLGIPGSESLHTGLIKNANTTCLIGKPFRHDLSIQLNRHIQIENDANCFSLSEATDGAGKNASSVFAVILGTGVGGGWVINKQLIIGPNHICGEWGHNPMPWPSDTDEPKQTCYCGKQGCIETYLSGPGWSQQTQLQFNLALAPKELIQQKAILPPAQKSYELYVDRLARSLASVINIMDPEVIVLGGGMSNIKSLYQDVPKHWGKYVFSNNVTTQLKENHFGDSSGVRGAAWLNQSIKSPQKQ
ncbi:ROK family protein [Oceaniserpentilla sp. 4NH20-0058]|uniref:ROK family protein n=1 Tax=Oceaniserpentilla sp. 4NH20-0058 TaxID=3127660 RepID=UPI003107C4F2